MAGLHAIPGLPGPETTLSNFMFSTGMVSDDCGDNSVAVRSVLWDTGNLSLISLLSQQFYNTNIDVLAPLSEDDNSTVNLADGASTVKSSTRVRATLTVQGVDGTFAHISSVFSVIPMPPGVDIILSLKDMVFEAPDMLLSMIQNAVEHVNLHRGSSKREHSQRLVYKARQIASGQPRRVRQPNARSHQLTSIDQTYLLNKGHKLVNQRRARDDVFAISLIDGTMFDEAALNNLTPTEAGQDVRPVWTQRDDVGPEERDSPHPGMFTDFLSFMESSIDEARAEYLAEVAKPPAQPPPPPNVPAGTTPPPLGTTKPAKRERFNPALYNLPGFREFMEKEAIDVFVPSNWDGIKVPPIDFQFRADMPDTHRGKGRPINPKRADIVEKEFNRLRAYHLVPSKSSIVSPITDADKATAPFVRICGDYRWVNTQILLDHEHIPHVRHELEKFKGFKYFIDLDMVNSFHQFRLAQSTSEKLSVITPWGSFRPVFMPEGVSPATGVLQGHMREIFKDFEEWAVVIFDNFCIGGDSMEDLFAKLKLFIARCKEYNIFLKMSKCFFGHDSVKFFGYEVDGNGWKIDDERKAAIMAIPFPSGPTTKLKVQRMQSFLGFSLYFRDFVEGYSTKAGELYNMTTKQFSWVEKDWTRDYRSIFEQFKLDLCKSFTLIFPDYSLPWVLQPDASNIGIGAILFQIRTLIGDDGVSYTRREPIACVSQKFSDPATRWAVIKQEMYAIYRSVEKLSYYLRHKAFQIQTDHSNLVQMEKSSVGIITRWRCFLQSFPITSIIHVAGKNNVAADYMSRVHECDRDVYDPPDNTKSTDPPLAFLAAATLTLPEQESFNTCTELCDFDAREIREFLVARCEPDTDCCFASTTSAPCDDSYCHACSEHITLAASREHVLATLSSPPTPPAHIDTYSARVPAFDAILDTVHGGPHLHFGALATWRLLQEQCVGHGIPMAYVRFYIRECPVCQKYRRTLSNDRIPHVIRHLKVPGPRSTVGIDGFTMTPPDKHGNSYLHVIVNHFTKHVFLFPSKSKDAVGAANALLTYVSMFGRFTRLISDPGSDYASDTVQKLNEYFGIDRAVSLVDRHESNGVEPTNRELKRHIQTLVHDKRFSDRWSEPQVLGLIAFHINNQRNSESGYSAFDCTFGSMQSDFFKSLGIESANFAPDSKYVLELTKDIAAIHEASNAFQQSLVAKRATDLSKPRNYWSPGDFVFVDNLAPLHKLQAPRLGPYEVISHYRNDVMLRDLITNTTKGFHVDRLSLFSGSAKAAFDLAMRDKNQHLVERFLAYRGDVNKRTTMEFLISYTDDPVPVWRTWDNDISDTAPFESFCKSLPQLEPLLSTADTASATAATLRKQRTDVTHHEGDIIFVDLRSRDIYDHEWYNSINIDDKDIVPRYNRMRVGRSVPRQRGITTGTRVELFDDVFDLVHRVDSHFLRYNGTLTTENDLPNGSEVVTRAFATAHPYVPINSVMHRSMEAADRLPVLTHLPTMSPTAPNSFRVLSYNVNGLLSALQRGFLKQLRDMEGGPPDVLLLQNTHAHMCLEDQFERLFSYLGYKHFTMVAGAPHYQSGIAVASKTPFLLLSNGPDVERGRALAIQVEGVTIVNIAAPIVCGTQPYMIQRRAQFDNALLAWLSTLPAPILVGGTFNLAANDQLDIVFPCTYPSSTMPLFTSPIERNLYISTLAAGYTDAFRALHPHTAAYTAFPAGSWHGIRIRSDYFMVSSLLHPSITACNIHNRTPLSDHAGIEISVKRLGTNPWFPFDSVYPTSPMLMRWLTPSAQQTPPPSQYHHNNLINTRTLLPTTNAKRRGRKTPQRPVSNFHFDRW